MNFKVKIKSISTSNVLMYYPLDFFKQQHTGSGSALLLPSAISPYLWSNA